MKRRTWYYLQSPKVFEMSPCSCGNEDTDWSEWEKHLWCEKCQKDFIPEHGGIFDGPIIVQVCYLLGITFDRFNLERNKVERFDIDNLVYQEDESKAI